jgi:hypothetical protein
MSDLGQLPEPTVWPTARRGVAALTVAVASATALAAALAGDAIWQMFLGPAFVLCTVVTLNSPRLVWLPVLAGVGLSWSLLEGREGTEALVMVPVIAGVVVTAELLAIVDRLEMIVPRDPVPDIARAVFVTATAAALGLVTLLAGSVDGPGGFAAVALGAAACIVLAVLLLMENNVSR